MAHGRWYPTVTALGDGRVMTYSGEDENGNTNKAVEFYTPGTGWSQQYSLLDAPALPADAPSVQRQSFLLGADHAYQDLLPVE